jgi:hypothetical protein
MKTTWNVISFLAVVNLMAIVLFVMWLWQSDRLSGDRIELLRETFGPTVTEASIVAEQRESEIEAERQREQQARRLEQLPIPAGRTVERVNLLEDMERQALGRVEDARRFHHEQFEQAMRDLQQREQRLEMQREQWERSVEAERARREDEQFAKTVQQYESIPPRQGKNMLLELINDGEMTQAVAYLDAMNPRAASKILGEFRTEAEIQLATRLLEELRRFGLEAEPDQDLAHADDLDQAP